MNKSIQKIITSASAMLMFTSVGAGINSMNVNAKRRSNTYRIYRNNYSGWHVGIPKFLNNSVWEGSFIKFPIKYNQYKYERLVTSFSNKLGYNPTPFFYNKHHHFINVGAESSYAAGLHPHYKYLKHNYYLITSGSRYAKNSLKNELSNNSNYNFGSTSLIKKHNQNHISIWSFNSNHHNNKNGKKEYNGYFTRR